MSASAPSSPARPSPMDRSIHISLREEVQFLRRKVVQLETAEADNERLRKDLSRTKMKMQEDRSCMELEFMNQLSSVSRENALKMEEVEGRLKESNNVNRMLSDQLEELGGLDGVEKRIRDVERIHQKEIARIVDNKHEEIERFEKELQTVRKSRDDVALKLEDTNRKLEKERQRGAEEARQSPTETMDESMRSALQAVQDENENLRAELKTVERKTEEKSQNELRAIREKLRARDSELNSKICEIRQLRSELQTSKSRSSAMVHLEKENQELKAEVEISSKTRREREATISRLENELRGTKHVAKKLENENQELKAAIKQQKEGTKDTFDGFPTRHSLGASPTPTGKRTSQLIMKLEENLKREGQKKHEAAMALKTRSSTDRVNEFQISSLKTEVLELKQQLEKEQSTAALLEKEILELKSAKGVSDVGTSSSSRLPAIPRTPLSMQQGSKSLDAILPPLRKGDDTDSRAAVKGIVTNIEKKIWRHQSTTGTTEATSIQRLMDRASQYPGLTEDLEEVRDELNYERLQVVELEDELTRQCEINCTLLKEISNLTTENETTRMSHAQSFGILNTKNYGDDQKEIDRLMMEVANVKSRLFSTEQSKSKLEEELDNMLREKAEAKSLREHLRLAEREVKSIGARMEEAASLDKVEIDRLQTEVNDLQVKLGLAGGAIEGLQGSSTARSLNRSDEQYDTMKEEYEQRCNANRATIDRYKIRVSDLEAEVAKSKDQLSDQKSKSRQQVEGLESLVEALQAKLVNVDQSRAALVDEKDKLTTEVSHLSKIRKDLEQQSEIQHHQLERLQQMVDEKVETFERMHEHDQEEIARLRDQVTSLEDELSSTLEKVESLSMKLQEREQMEDQVDELSRKNVQSLHEQINKLQKEMTKKQVEVSEAETETRKKIDALEDMIDTLQVEMDMGLAEKENEIDELKNNIEEKEGKIRQVETEKEQLVLSMNDMMKSRRDEIDELQSELMEMSSRAANQTREVQTLKSQLEESKYRKDEMDRLRTRVTEMSHQLSVKANDVSSPSNYDDRTWTNFEIENSALRQKLREAITERQAAQDKLSEYVADKGGSSKTVQVLRERNTALKFEVEKLTKKLRKVAERQRLSSSTSDSRTSSRSQIAHRHRTEPSWESAEPTEVEATRFVI